MPDTIMSDQTGDLIGGEVLDLRGILMHLWAGRLWIAAIATLITAVAAALAFTMTPVFRATAVLVPATAERPSLGSSMASLGAIASLAGVNLNTSSLSAEEALAVLRSREFTSAFIKDLNLMPDLFAKMWDANARTWKVGSKPPTPAQAYRYFDQKVRFISQDKKTGLVTLNIEWRDPAKPAAWATALLLRVNGEMRGRAILKADASLGYLQKELAATEVVETRDAINRLIEKEMAQRMVANVTQEFAFRVVDHPALSDPDDWVRPNRPLMIIGGLLAGVIIGCLFVYVRALAGGPRQRAIH